MPRPALDSDTISTTEQTVVTERVAGWAKSDVVAARTSSGLISPAYEPLRHALDRAVLTMPSFIDTDDPAAIGRAVIDGWQPGAERYARTGAAYDEPAGRLEGFERPSEFAAGIADARTRNALGFFAAGARLQEFADGRAGGSLIAEVEVVHAVDGTLRTVRMVQASGHRGFDDFVLTQARTVADALKLDGGVRDNPFRSLWRFTGTLTFRRKLGGLKDLTPRAALGLVTMSLLSALSGVANDTPPDAEGKRAPMGPRVPGFLGRFDENGGALDVVDLTNPGWTCKVTLLEAD